MIKRLNRKETNLSRQTVVISKQLCVVKQQARRCAEGEEEIRRNNWSIGWLDQTTVTVYHPLTGPGGGRPEATARNTSVRDERWREGFPFSAVEFG